MSEIKEQHHTGEAQVPREFRDDEQKEQTEEMEEKVQHSGDTQADLPSKPRDDEQKQQPDEYRSRYASIEKSYGSELLKKIRKNFSFAIDTKNVLLCIHKYDSKVLVERDIQNISRVIELEGNALAANALLDHLVLYKGWLPCLLNTLRDPKVLSGHVASEIEQAAAELQEVEQRDSKEMRYYLNEVTYGEKLLQKLRPNLSHCLSPKQVLLCIHHHNPNVLPEVDRQRIQCVITNKGDIEGANCLLDHIVRYKGWLLCLLKVLRDPTVSQAYLADEMEQALELMQDGKK